MIYKQPVKIIKEIPKKKVVKDAHYKQIETGRKKVVETIEKDGKTQKEEIPIVESLYIPAQYQEIIEKREFYGVENKNTKEIHEFATIAEAKRFIKESS